MSAGGNESEIHSNCMVLHGSAEYEASSQAEETHKYIYQCCTKHRAFYPDYAEVEFGLLSTLQYKLEASLALIGHPIVIVPLQDPLLLRCEH